MVISKINESNPLSKIRKDQVIDISKIIKLALQSYWLHLLSENPQLWDTPPDTINSNLKQIDPLSKVSDFSPAMKRPNAKATAPIHSILKVGMENPKPSETDRSFEANENFARLLFLDLPLEGKIGTLNLLAGACMKECFDVDINITTAYS